MKLDAAINTVSESLRADLRNFVSRCRAIHGMKDDDISDLFQMLAGVKEVREIFEKRKQDEVKMKTQNYEEWM